MLTSSFVVWDTVQLKNFLVINTGKQDPSTPQIPILGPTNPHTWYRYVGACILLPTPKPKRRFPSSTSIPSSLSHIYFPDEHTCPLPDQQPSVNSNRGYMVDCMRSLLEIISEKLSKDQKPTRSIHQIQVSINSDHPKDARPLDRPPAASNHEHDKRAGGGGTRKQDEETHGDPRLDQPGPVHSCLGLEPPEEVLRATDHLP
ncbi:hypothetical protein PGTUg99_004691 [Puccinia graminis f. sp. tritici]|uniref:Uncharacterized protein n=1 Tax=Puccinia graminis f. sp. tritici TaxID=56615 RepID=A0A5B0PE74_PUCGR|nr:hypothetical protein PGTUg99_004691 [Puccinia graminis f. sp. tritici]